MIEIQVQGLVKSFEIGKNILDGLTFQIDQGERVGLLGRNGAGKTTLFRILTGELEQDEGTVTIGSGRRIGLISQIPVFPDGWTVEDVLHSAFSRLQSLADEMRDLTARMANGESDPAILRRYGYLNEKFEAFGGYDTDVAVNKVANGLSISDGMRTQPFDSLSGGEKTRVNLGRLILEDTDILLLDEPTNHLDLHATEWLEDYVARFKGTVVAISHDRYFLDRAVTRVIEIADGKAEFYSGNYSFYAVEKERRFQERMKQYQKEQAKIEQLTEASEKLRLWAFMGNDALYKRAISMERRIERMRTTAKPSQARKMDARFNAAEFQGDEVLALRGVAKSFGERKLFDGISLKIEGGERIGLIGDNGTGKSTLIKMIMDEEYPDDGRIRVGPSVKTAYLPQIMHFEHPDWNLVENMMSAKRGLSAQSARNRLAAYDFRGEDVLKPVSVLSGGEQSRLRLCMLMDDEINFLILDEPTNHLDIDSREWIEDAVEAYDGTLLFVSHDRYFINRFATRIWELSDGTITDYPMGFAQYRQMKALEAATPKKEEPFRTAQDTTPAAKPRGNKAQVAARKQLVICERHIAETEARIAELDQAMIAAACDYEKLNELMAEKEAVQLALSELYEKWESLSEEAES
jgi:ATP-binding cassette subfamily F protein 3